ncbi:MAG TPA: tRNA 2-thiouridine(34) synthase MnmA [Flavobacteriales bacterium]
MSKRVVVGLSGGVDSSVAAHLLLEQGYEVIGIFMRNWHDESVTINNECPWIDDSNDAMLAAEWLGIPFHVLDMSAQYKTRIVDYMFAEYEAGRTPNPDVLCNREIKFDLFLEAALQLKADFVATGHYCQKDSFINEQGETIYRLLAGADPNKDQSYFLCQLRQSQLAKALFPIGHLQKSQVREIAKEIGLPNAAKKDSQGLCFIGKVKLPVFLQQQLKPKKGKIVEVPLENHGLEIPAFPQQDDEESLAIATAPFDFETTHPKVIGEHNGAHFYTIGQRRGLGVGGKQEPLFIVDTDARTNTVYTAQGENHPALLRRGLSVNNQDVHWIRTDLALKVGESATFMVRIRYRQPLFECRLYQRDNSLYCVFTEPQKSVARGQFIAWYKDNELIGSGVIS